MGIYNATLTNQYGLPIAGALVTVSAYDGALATLTNLDDSPKPNPFTTDDLGDISFKATDGLYTFDYREGGRLVRREVLPVGSLIAAVNPSPENAGLAIALDADGNPTYSDLVGSPGPDGPEGPSAYEIAVANGFVGTEADFLASLVGPMGPAGEATEDTQIRSNLVAATPASLTLTDAGIDTQTLVTTGSDQANTDMISHWWQTPQNRLWGMDGGYAFNNVQPFQWAMFSMAENLYWRGKNGNTDAATKFKQNFDEILARKGQTLLQTASLANDIGAVDDAAWTMQNFERVPQLLGATTGATALAMAKNLFTSTVSVFADPNNSGAGLLYTTDANSVSLGHHRVSSLNDIWIAIIALYLYQNGGTTTHLNFATHTYSWVKQYMMHPTGVLYMELDVDPTHGSAFMKPIGYSVPPDPIKPHFSYTWIAGAFAFMTLCKRLNDIAPDPQYITDINAMMAAVLRTDTFLRPGDVFLNDRDGWAGGYGFCEFVDQVLPLTAIDTPLKERIKQVITNTALSIINQRTDRFYYNRGATYGAGFYGSDWSGPELGANGMATWFQTGNDANGGIAIPEQIMTTGSNIMVITAAAMIGSISAKTQYVPYTDLIPRIQKMVEGSIQSVGNKTIRDDLNVGGTLRLDTNAFFSLAGGNYQAGFDNQDFFLYDRAANTGSYKIGGATVFYYNAGGLSVTGGISASDSVFAGTSADLNFSLGINGVNRSLAFDASGDYLNYNRTTNTYTLNVANSAYLTVNNAGASVAGGLSASGAIFAGTAADLNFNLGINGVNRSLAFDTGGDYFNFNRTTNKFDLYVGNSSVFSVGAAGTSTGALTSGSTTINGPLSVNGSGSFSGTMTVSGGGFWTGGLSSFGVVQPGNDNSYALGGGTNRWTTVYAVTGAINTSDERDKEWRGSLSADELAAAKEIAATIGVFQFKSAIEEKGSAEARLHVGVKAQQAGAIMTAHGLNPSHYGWFCYDEWDAIEAVPEVPFIPFQPATFNDDGEQLTPEVPEQALVPGVAARSAGNRYGVRYEELAMFIAAAQEQRLRALEA